MVATTSWTSKDDFSLLSLTVKAISEQTIAQQDSENKRPGVSRHVGRLLEQHYIQISTLRSQMAFWENQV